MPPEDHSKTDRATNRRKQVEVVIPRPARTGKRSRTRPEKDDDAASEIASEAATESRPASPELPYRDVPPVRYAGRTETQRSQPPPAAAPPKEKNYEVRAPVEEYGPDDAEELVTEIFGGLEVGVPLNKLFSISPRLLRQAKKVLSKRRVPAQVRATLEQLLEDLEANGSPSGSSLALPPAPPVAESVFLQDLPYTPRCRVTDHAEGLIPRGAVIVEDAAVQYWQSVPAGQTPMSVFIAYADVQRAGESASLKCVHPLINGTGEEESILDDGSQIVSMSQAVAEGLGVSWDPDTCIYMQSANGQSEKSVGLARNVPFSFGDWSVYLQVHIIRAPAYKILLGRPFSILTASSVENSTDGGQRLTLTDPATRKRVTVPTFDRGAVRQLRKIRDTSTDIPEGRPTTEQKFQNSRS